jgi:hypothetical protein
MADIKVIITSVKEAVCTNCIYYGKSDERFWCHHNDVSDTLDLIATEWFCDKGRWVADDKGDRLICPQGLSDVYYIFQGGAYK